MEFKKWNEILKGGGTISDYGQKIIKKEHDELADIVVKAIRGSTSLGKYHMKKIAIAREYGEINELANYIKTGQLSLDDIFCYTTTASGYEKKNIKDILKNEVSSFQNVDLQMRKVAAIVIDHDNIKKANISYRKINPNSIYIILRTRPTGSGFSGFKDIEKAIYNKQISKEIKFIK